MCSFEHTSSSYVERRCNWRDNFSGGFNLHLCDGETLTPSILLIPWILENGNDIARISVEFWFRQSNVVIIVTTLWSFDFGHDEEEASGPLVLCYCSTFLVLRAWRAHAQGLWLCSSTICIPMLHSSFRNFMIAFDAMLSKMLKSGLNPFLVR